MHLLLSSELDKAGPQSSFPDVAKYQSSKITSWLNRLKRPVASASSSEVCNLPLHDNTLPLGSHNTKRGQRMGEDNRQQLTNVFTFMRPEMSSQSGGSPH